MRALDILAVVSGVAGIASFAVTLLERFSQWRRYLVPVSAFLLGYALSAASMLLFPSMAMGVSTSIHGPSSLSYWLSWRL